MNRPKPPGSKTELLSNIVSGRQAWDSLLNQISDDEMKVTGVEGVWSVRDVLAHITGYEQYAWAMLWDKHHNETRQTATFDAYYQTHLTLYRAQHPDFPEKIQQVQPDQINSLFAAAYQFKLPKEVRAMEREAYQRLLEMVQLFTDEAIKSQFTPNGKSLMDLIPNQCYMHYYLHAPAIEKFLAGKQK